MSSDFGLDAVLLVLSWVGAGLITYGFLKRTIIDFERRLLALEKSNEKFVTRIEYDNRHADLLRQLDRIESKIDKMNH